MSTDSRAAGLGASSVVDDTYRIEEAIARGGFSHIYRATHIEMNQPVALKVLPIDEDVDPAVLERFSQEARLASLVHHPNLVHVFAYGQDARGFLYIAMEWLDGTSLHDLVEEEGRLSPLRAAEMSLQITRGLAAAHGQGVLHRDLKPSNVMLLQYPAGDEVVKVLDFGIAKALAESSEQQLRITADDMFVGTPRYAAPEQIQGHDLSEGTDIYGVGLIMWEALVGEPAVSGVDFKECVSQHLSGDPWKLPDDLDVPGRFRHVVHRALNKRPDDRYASCVDMAEDLEEVVDELRARPASRLKLAADALRTAPAWTKVAAGVVALGAAAYLGIVVAGPPLPPRGVEQTEASPLAAIEKKLESRGWRVELEATDVGRYEIRVREPDPDFVLRLSSGEPAANERAVEVGGDSVVVESRKGREAARRKLLRDLRALTPADATTEATSDP